MDFNFADLKKEAADTADDIFKKAQEATRQKSDEVQQNLLDGLNNSSGVQDDNAHTEHYFANEQKGMDFEQVDPQTFVQRMSAGAKAAQEELDAKFSQSSNTVDDFLQSATQNLENFGSKLQDTQKGIASLTDDFMNAERNLYGGAGDITIGAPKPQGSLPTSSHTDDLLNLASTVGDVGFPASVPAAANTNTFYEDEFGVPSFMARTSTEIQNNAPSSNKDSDSESTSVSYNPSPARKNPITDALKEQDNEKFISSEDLLDLKEDRTATPDFQSAKAVPSQPSHTFATKSSIPTTDLDADEDFDFNFAPASKVTETKKVAPAVPITSKIESTPSTSSITMPAQSSVAAPAPKPAESNASVHAAKNETKPTPIAQKITQPTMMATDHILLFKNSLDAWFKPERLHPRVESLIYWRDVKKSGIVFGAGLITLLAISCFSVISVFAYLSLIVLAGTMAFRIYKSVMQAIQKTSEGHPFKEYLEIDLTLSQEKVQHIAGVAVAHLNGFITELRRLFLVEDIVDSIKFAVILWAMSYIGGWFNGMTLVILAFVSLFTLPKVYENKKESIDTYLDLVRNKLTEITDKAKVAIPIGIKKPAIGESDKEK